MMLYIQVDQWVLLEYKMRGTLRGKQNESTLIIPNASLHPKNSDAG